MISYIIYEHNESSIKNYVSIINEFMMNNKDNYKIEVINKYDKAIFKELANMDSKKIFIVNYEFPEKSGIEFSKEIRTNGDWLSPIIIYSNKNELNNNNLKNRLLMLEFITNSKTMNKDILDCLIIAYKIISSHKAFKFKYSGEYYQIPYHSILFIEKNLNDNYSILYTKRNKYIVKDSINNIFNTLNDNRFFQSHRSCIINLDNILSIDFTNSIINFGILSTDLLSREAKKELKNIILV